MAIIKGFMRILCLFQEKCCLKIIYKDPRNQKVTAMKKLITLLFIIACYSGWGQIIISGYLANPQGTDGNYEYVQLKATSNIDFAITNYSVVVCNNGTVGANGWIEGAALSYKFNLTSGTVTSGSVFYVGGSGKLINGSGSTDISSANWIRSISVATSTGDGFGLSNTSGVFGNGGANADGIAIFSGTTPTSSSIPIDAIFYGIGVGSSLSSNNGYKVPTNDVYNSTQGLFGQGNNLTYFSDATSNNFIKLTGTYDLATSTWTTPRTSSVITLSTTSTLSIIESGITLPVILSAFGASKHVKVNELNWSTESEQNNSGFEIQRSTDAVNFEKIGFVKSLSATGNSSSRLDYTFTDYNPVGLRQYYRLKQTDFDGTSKYSAVVLVTREAPTALQLTHVYPNPSRESLYINTASPTKMELQLLVIDLGGRVVGKKQVSAEIGNNGFDIPVAHLASGTYILKVLNSSQQVVATEKFIKQ